MNTTENNKLIAEFYGLDEHFFISENVGQELREFNDDELRFDTSWDWLMPVVERIENIGFEFFIVENRSKVCHNTDKSIDVLSYLEGGNKLDITYQTVVEFIKWYNENK